MARTVFLYTSDHGYHSGQWGVAYCKMLPYEVCEALCSIVWSLLLSAIIFSCCKTLGRSYLLSAPCNHV